MHIDIDAARRFLYDNARLLERHLASALLDGAATDPVLTALRAYRTRDGGWGHALEPDLRGPDSQVSAAMSALGVLAQIGASSNPLIEETADWLESVTLPDGSVPHVLPTASTYPRAPWMQPSDAGILTYLTAAHLWDLGADHPWLASATQWCWNQIETQPGVPQMVGKSSRSTAVDPHDSAVLAWPAPESCRHTTSESFPLTAACCSANGEECA